VLDALEIVVGAVEAVRLVAPDKSYVAALAEMGVTSDDFDENIAYFGDLDATPQIGLDWIFVKRGQVGRAPSRFTDGSVPVFYTALDRPTAERETQRWLSAASDKFYFRQLTIEFEGPHIDLRALVPPPAYLTGEPEDGAYKACFEISKQALALPCDAFKTPSARLPDGVCFPILARPSIKGVHARGYVRFELDDATGQWNCRNV